MILLLVMCGITQRGPSNGEQFQVRYDLKDMAGSVVVLLTIAAITFAMLAM